MPCAPSPEVWIVPAFVTVTLPALPPVPPAPPTFRPTSTLLVPPATSREITELPLPPPPPRLCAKMPYAWLPVVTMLAPCALVTVTLPDELPLPPVPPMFMTSELEEEPLANADRPSCATRPALPP